MEIISDRRGNDGLRDRPCARTKEGPKFECVASCTNGLYNSTPADCHNIV